jgi:hypothetical protein
VPEFVLVEDGDRKAEVFVKEIPSERGDFLASGGLVEGAEPFLKWGDFIVGRAGAGQCAVSVAKVRISPAVDARPLLLYL